jgi:uncharacterized damage-inducible protein DinB
MQTPVEVITALECAPKILVPLISEVPDEIRRRRPSPGKWSAHEHFVHLTQVHPLFFQRLESMLHQEKPPRIAPYNPGRDDEEGALLALDFEDAAARFEADRATLLGRLRGLSSRQWALEAEHGEYKRYSVFIMFRHLALHDFFHGYRIEDLLLNRKW